MLENRDYTLIIDKSQSMVRSDRSDGKSRWEDAGEAALALARKCEEFDPDGITVYVFSSRFRRYDNVTAEKVAQVFAENDPMGDTNLADVLEDALNNYFQRKEAGEAKPAGETFIIVTDGEPNDRKRVMQTIVKTSRQIDRDEEIGISFVQIGEDRQATRFFKALDDEMQSVGAKFDIVDTVTLHEMANMSLSDVLLNALID